MADDMEHLMDDFGRRPTLTRRMIYFLLSLEAVATTALLFSKLFVIDLQSSKVTLTLAAIAHAAILSLSYHRLAFAKAARIRVDAVAPKKGAFKGRPPVEYEKAVAKFERAISNSALWYSCGYNNAIFMLAAPLLGVYMLSEKLAGDLNLLVAGAAAGALALFNSNSALKAIGEAQ